MKERGLGTPATRADIIDGLIYQKYMDRQQRELVPTRESRAVDPISRGGESRRPDESRHDR